MSGMWKRGYGRATKAPPDERGGKQTCPAYRHRATFRLYRNQIACLDPDAARSGSNGSRMLRVSRPIDVVVLNCWVTATKLTPWRSNSSTIFAKSIRDRVNRST